jgi:hypothetical protein
MENSRVDVRPAWFFSRLLARANQENPLIEVFTCNACRSGACEHHQTVNPIYDHKLGSINYRTKPTDCANPVKRGKAVKAAQIRQR